MSGEKIVDAANGDWPKLGRIIVEDADSDASKLTSHSVGIAPMVMVSKDCDDSEPRLQSGERRDRFFDTVFVR